MAKKKSVLKKTMLFILGVATLILGIFLLLLWWGDLVAFLRGVVPVVLAVGGLLILYSIGKV